MIVDREDKVVRRTMDISTVPLCASGDNGRDGDARAVHVLTSLEQLNSITSAWADLAEHAAEPNVFYEPWFLIPALRDLLPGAEVYVCVVWRTEGGDDFASAGRILDGFFPLLKADRFHGLPCRTLESFRHCYDYCLTPLVRVGRESVVAHSFLTWLHGGEHGCHLLYLREMAVIGPVAQALGDAFRERFFISEESPRYERALMSCNVDVEGYLDAVLNLKKRKEFRRLGRRLAERGHVSVECFECGADVEPWIEQFLQLESLGWKGRAGTALASKARDALFFREMIAAAASRGRLMLLRLCLDGKPLAMKCNLLSGAGAFAFKIAYDEDYAKYSPGVLLELEHIRRLSDRHNTATQWIDSCAVPEHFMANRLWRERRPMADRVVACSTMGAVVVIALPLLRACNRFLQMLNRRLELR